jgi:DNA-binding protein HU-beta
VRTSTGLKKTDAEKVVNAVIDSIAEALAEGDKVQLIGFGNFEIRERKAKETKNPRTKEVCYCPAKKVPVFKPSKILKDSVN